MADDPLVTRRVQPDGEGILWYWDCDLVDGRLVRVRTPILPGGIRCGISGEEPVEKKDV